MTPIILRHIATIKLKVCIKCLNTVIIAFFLLLGRYQWKRVKSRDIYIFFYRNVITCVVNICFLNWRSQLKCAADFVLHFWIGVVKQLARNALFSVGLYLKSHWGRLFHNIWSYGKCLKDVFHCRCLLGFWFSSCVFICFVFTGFRTCCKNNPITGRSNPKVRYNRTWREAIVRWFWSGAMWGT